MSDERAQVEVIIRARNARAEMETVGRLSGKYTHFNVETMGGMSGPQSGAIYFRAGASIEGFNGLPVED